MSCKAEDMERGLCILMEIMRKSMSTMKELAFALECAAKRTKCFSIDGQAISEEEFGRRWKKEGSRRGLRRN